MIFFDIDNTLVDHDHAMRQGARRFQTEFADIFPIPAIFETAGRQAGCPVEDCVYIGDQLENDARAAIRAGMTGIWLNRQGPSGEAAGLEPVIAIDSLDRLPQCLS